MPIDPTSPPTRGRSSHLAWLGDIFGSRSSGGRSTRISDLPPRVREDIGLSQDFVDVMLRHRR